MNRNFNTWFQTFKDSIANWRYYTDFDKVIKNVGNIKIELNILNSLIGSKNIKLDFLHLLHRYPEVIKVIPILLAVRQNEILVNDTKTTLTFDFKNPNYSNEQYAIFMEKTGLFNLLEHHIINNLEDYVTGVEVGLDSNARKNRTGTTMENLVEDYLVEEGFKKGVSYFPQMKATDIYKCFGINVTGLDEKKKAEKKFDFVVKTKNQVYAIEVNFYSGGGSKLNETARSYKTIAEESKTIKGFKFVWITDGKGWNDARRNLEETFTAHPYVFNIHDMESGLLKEALKEK